MSNWSVTFLVMSFVAGYLAFGGVVEASAAAVAKYVFFALITACLVLAVLYQLRRKRR